jgi:AbrB family looped-hinge helix DNA binding protein
MSMTRIRSKGQITIPDDVRKAAGLNEGDLMEVSVEGETIVLRPTVAVPRSQAWFWTTAWQAGERQASADIDAGRTTLDEGDDALLNALR